MKVSTRLTFDKLVFNKDNELHLVVSLTAPKISTQTTRAPILVLPVIDISGSMDGDKLNYAKESVIKLIDHLQPGDFAGIITFESRAELVASPTEITQSKKDELKSKVRKLFTKGSTAFADGMLLALDQVNKASLPDNVLIRIIMFTDGQANVGPRGKQILELVEQNLGKASVSAFGYGGDADHELLADLSVRAKGNFAFIKNPDDAPAAFAKELGGLLSTHATNIVVDIKAEDNIKVQQVSEVTSMIDNNLTSLRIPELLSEEVRNLVVKLKTLKLSQAEILTSNYNATLVNVNVSYDVIEDGVKVSHKETLPVTVEFVSAGEEQTKPTQEVDAIVALAQMVKAQVEAEKLASIGQYDAAFITMNSASADMLTRGHVAISSTTSKIGQKMRSRTQYDSSASYRSSTKSAGVRGMGLSSGDSEALQDINDIGVASVNSSQEELMKSFTTPADPESSDSK